MKALDLFCKAGGATKGLQMAGFHVTGVDIEEQTHYCGDAFIQADALTVDLAGYHFYWAGPVCKKYTVASRRWKRSHPDQIGAIRERLKGLLYCIENVPGAPLLNPYLLCGQMFGLPLTRHRLFETNVPLMIPGHPKCHGLAMAGEVVAVHGHGCAGNKMKRGIRHTTSDWCRAMEINWMTRDELSQAIPPAYSRYIGEQAVKFIETKVYAMTQAEEHERTSNE